MVADVVDRAARRLGGLRRDGGTVPESSTRRLPLLGADGYRTMWAMRSEVARRHGVFTGVVEHLLERYGALAGPVLSLIDDDPELGRPLAGAPEYLAAEVVYAVTAEAALSLDDVLARRLRVAIETTHRGAGSATHAARLIGPVLGWDEATRRRRVEEFVARIDGERRSQKMPDDEAAAAALTDPPWPVSPG